MPLARRTTSAAVLLVLTWMRSETLADSNVFVSSADAYIYDVQFADCSSNTGTDTTMRVGTGCGKGCTALRSLLRFSLSSIPSGSTVTSAALAVYVESQTGPDFPVYVYRLLQPGWSESGTTWKRFDCPNNGAWSRDGGDFTTTTVLPGQRAA